MQLTLLEMPFVCKFQLNNSALNDSDKVRFLEYIDSSFGVYHAEKIKIAKVIYNDQPAFISTNSPSFPSSKGNLVEGELVDEHTVIGYFSADGEDIPYDKPYAIITLE